MKKSKTLILFFSICIAIVIMSFVIIKIAYRDTSFDNSQNIVVNPDEFKTVVLHDENIQKLSKAVKNNDSSALTDEKDLFVFNKVKSIINTIIKDDMTVYEKELAVHDYIIKNCEYDPDKLSALNRDNPESEIPYGVLKNKRGICLGYTGTFQLFMDVLDIPCISIKASADMQDHGWNMVQIDNEWYHVDLTWDDPVPNEKDYADHTYFNVTDKVMSKRHDWDKSLVYKADSTKYRYKK